jgi:hypothetical protein
MAGHGTKGTERFRLSADALYARSTLRDCKIIDDEAFVELLRRTDTSMLPA